MKKIIINVKHLAGVLGGVFLMSLPLGFASCKEEIDESNFAIKSEMTAADFINADARFSMIKSIFSTVRLGASENASPIFSALTARGNYTVFLPTNDAVELFMQSEGLTSLEELLNNSEKANLVAKSCIIDHKDEHAYETADFPQKGAFEKPNLNDRLLACQFDSVSTNYVVNGTSMVVDEDNEVSNGFIHVVDAVVAPSALTLDKLIGEADNMKVFSYLLQRTTWADSLYENLDVSYENPDRPLTFKLPIVDPFTQAQHRYIGYTALVETDDVYQKAGISVVADENGNVTNGDDIMKAVAELAEPVYGNGKAGAEDYSHPDNAVNRFVAYHLIHGKMAYNKLVHHYNEIFYKYSDPKNPQTRQYPTNVWDFYLTMGQHRSLLKITQVGESSDVEPDKMNHPIYVNRISEYADGPEEDYRETGIVQKGILIEATNGENDNNGLNGYYYPIKEILLYSNDFRTALMQRRIRFDVSTVLPELLSNSVRGIEYTSFDNGYFTNISRESPDTKLLYLMNKNVSSWCDYQGDEFMVAGLYDFTLRMPPVPVDGTYEVRMGVSHNKERSMCQIYAGEDPDRLTPAGLPYDMRQHPVESNPALPLKDDVEDWNINRENDKNLRNQGYMKAPQYYTVCDGEGGIKNSARKRKGGAFGSPRRIVGVFHLKANRPFYLRFKTALKKTDAQFFMDYFEYASTNVYNGPVAEDIW